MAEINARHWHRRKQGWSLRAAIIFSCLVHTAVFSLVLVNWRSPQPKAIPISFDMQFVSPPTPDPDPEARPIKAPPAPPKKVEPEPKKEEPIKEEPKKEPVKVAEKKPEPKKKEPVKKPEKKPEPKKTPPKKEAEKKPEPTPATPANVPQPEVVAKMPPPSAGVQNQQLPPMLNMWGRQVQRKVAPYWIIPAGMQLTPENHEVQVTFWVQRDGTLLGQPTADKPLDFALVQSCIQAIVNAQPLPPLPLEFVGDRQQVVYVFSLTDTIAAGGGTG